MGWGNSYIYGPKNNSSLTAAGFLFVGYIITMVGSILWWTRLSPWFKYIEDLPDVEYKPRALYDRLMLTWIIALVGIIGLIVYVIVYVCCHRVGKARWVSALFVAIYALYCIGFGAGTAYLAIPTGMEGAFDNNKCSKKYDYGINLVLSYVLEHMELFERYTKWSTARFLKLHPNGIDKPVYGYVCAQVGYPTLFGGIMVIIGLFIMLISLLIPCCKCGKLLSEGSGNEDVSI